jgi:hypothetical protein
VPSDLIYKKGRKVKKERKVTSSSARLRTRTLKLDVNLTYFAPFPVLSVSVSETGVRYVSSVSAKGIAILSLDFV